MKKQLENELDNIEHESMISNPNHMENILKDIGFYEIVQVKKKRKKCKYQDLEICVDNVEGLGDFIEVEKLCEEGDSLQVQEELFRFLESLGVRREDRIMIGYDTLVYNKFNNINQNKDENNNNKNLSLRDLQNLIMQQAKEKGFGTKPFEINVSEKIALIHSEVSEAFEAYRKQNIDGKDGFKEELGDTIQRILHLAGIFNINIENEIIKKLESNKDRDWNWDKLNEGHV